MAWLVAIMAEVAASVIALIEISKRIISACKIYVDAVCDVPSDIHVLVVELTTLQTLLEVLHSFTAWNTGVKSMIHGLSGKTGPIDGCHRSLTSLEKLIPKDLTKNDFGGQAVSKKRKTQRALASLAWPFKEERAKKLMTEISQYKETITVALMTKSIQDLDEIKTKASEIDNKLSDSQRFEIYRWLQHTDPSPIHHQARKNREPGTGDWVLRHPDWMDWLSAKQRCLWLHGIPGAGKTVLISYLIEQVKTICENTQSKAAHVYYYFYFGRNQDEAKPFLKWLLSQLCRKQNFVSSEVRAMFGFGGEPSLEELLTALAEMLHEFDVVYVVCDAIDESMPRENLLQVLHDFVTNPRFEKLQLLASSREYLDIENVMKKSSVSLSMANPFVDEDIRTSVRKSLEVDLKFRTWPQDLVQETENALVVGAKGMFRWAVCQIDALRRLKPEHRIIRRALKDLPETLFETYDRIFLNISERERHFVHEVLRWIDFHSVYDGRDMPSDTLLHGVEKSIIKTGQNENNNYFDLEILRELCGCLVSTKVRCQVYGRTGRRDLSAVTAISFAHYTVSEYFNSSHFAKTFAQSFWFSEQEKNLDILEIVISEALEIHKKEAWAMGCYDFHPSEMMEKDFATFSVPSAIISISKRPDIMSTYNSVYSLAMELLNPFASHYYALGNVMSPLELSWTNNSLINSYWEMEETFWQIRWEQPCVIIEAAQLLNLALHHFENEDHALTLIEKFLLSNRTKELFKAQLKFVAWNMIPSAEGMLESCWFDGASIIEVLAQIYTHPKRFNLLLEHGSGLISPSKVLLLFLANSFEYGGFRILRSLLKMGADPNFRGQHVNPLQIAVAAWDFNAVAFLLEAGANPNGISLWDGKCFSGNTLLDRFEPVRKLSPLQIYYDHEMFVQKSHTDVDERYADRPKIEKLLLEYGARAFINEF